MIFQEGKVLDIVYGSDIPLLSRTISAHIKDREGSAQRVFYEFDDPIAVEKIEWDRIKAEQDVRSKALHF